MIDYAKATPQEIGRVLAFKQHAHILQLLEEIKKTGRSDKNEIVLELVDCQVSVLATFASAVLLDGDGSVLLTDLLTKGVKDTLDKVIKIKSRLVRQPVAGIDYGRGSTNIDPETGIRYGVISQNHVISCWAECSEPVYPDDEVEGSETERYEYVEPIGFTYEGGGYKITQAFDNTELFILKSPYYTRAKFCSPCAPGAGNLDDYCQEGAYTYCLDVSWFDDENPPYDRIWLVENDELVWQKPDSK